MSTLDIALCLACKAHADQTDKSGRPYILHPLRLMLQCVTDEERITAVLHDVVEDSSVSLEALRQLGFSERIVLAVDTLTRRSEETYEDFIERINLNPLARSVKMIDLRDNLDVTRLADLTPEDLARVAKYHRALRTLSSGMKLI